MAAQQGVFTISLDFELHWGCLETKPLLDDAAQRYFLNTRQAIPLMLSAFSRGEIHVTWAAVGMLFCKSATEWHAHKPHQPPAYTDKSVSVYEWVTQHGFSAEECPFHFAPDLINLILQTPYQELGTHTFSHFFCWEDGQTPDDFRTDLLTAKKLAAQREIQLRSLVFPRNQYRASYLDVCKEVGIRAVRTNPDVWYWTPVAKSGFWRKVFRTADAYLPFTKPKVISLDQIDSTQSPLHLPASRLYRPWQPRFSFLNRWKTARIKQEMTAAAKTGGYYHLWWHPHNFGNYPEQCLKELNELIQHFHDLKKKYGFRSMTMGELTEYITRNNSKTTHN